MNLEIPEVYSEGVSQRMPFIQLLGFKFVSHKLHVFKKGFSSSRKLDRSFIYCTCMDLCEVEI